MCTKVRLQGHCHITRARFCASRNARTCEHVFGKDVDYTVVTQATRRELVHRFDTHQGCP